MKKTAIAAALLIVSGATQAATLTAGETFDINILADGTSCFTFGNCVGNAAAAFVDNNNDAMSTAGSAIMGDGLAGVINVTTASDGAGGVNFSVNSFNMDTYIGTAGGFFGTWADDTSAMTGSVDASGNISFDPTGRMGIAQFFVGSLGAQPWNTGSTFTSGNQVNAVANLTGSALANDGSATIVSASSVGAAWGFFVGTPYTEIFSLDFSNATIVEGGPAAVPVPAAVWLFGSGLVGLAGVARRRKAA